jgi:hypothetical protein
MPRWARIAWLATVLACPAAFAQPTSYVLMSLVGFELTIVTPGGALGARLDTNRYERVPLRERVFDAAALGAMEEAILARRPEAKVTLLAGADPAWADAARLGLDPSSRSFAALVEGIASIAERAGHDRLVLMLPAEGEIALVAADGGRRGSGRASGLGMYLDRTPPLRRDGIATVRGFLGLFANVRIAIIDIRKRALLAEGTALDGVAVTSDRSPDGDPANVLSAAEKVAELRKLIRQAAEHLLSDLVART